MLLRYNGIDLLPGATQEFSVRPLRDPTGLDSTWTEVTIGCIVQWNPKMLASNKPAGVPLGYQQLGQSGDRAGVSFLNLREKLLEVRKPLLVDLGPDRIFRVPRLDKLGIPMVCDPSGGPFPEDCRILAVSGDKTVTMAYRIRFAFSDCDRMIVSHRWSSSGAVDEAFRTSRVVEGRAILRLDMLESEKPDRLVADQFRAAFAHPLPDGMVRKNVRVQVLPDGKELTYSFEDREVERNLGRNSPAYKIEGTCTAGSDSPVQSVKALGESVVDLAKKLFGHAMHGEPVSAGATGMAAIWSKLIASPKANGCIRVFGLPGASRSELIRIALDVLLDRFGPLSLGLLKKKLTPVSFYVTQGVGNEDPPWIELRAEFLPLGKPGLKAMFSVGSADQLMFYDADITRGADGAAKYPQKVDPGWGNPVPPMSGGSRGRWAGNLVGQILATACAPPAAPPPAPNPRAGIVVPAAV